MFITRLILLCIALVFTSLSHAQTTYRWIDKATGKTVFSDQPPPSNVKTTEIKGEKRAEEDKQQPYAVRQAAEKYPVTLYTQDSCANTCTNARDLLNSRGVPFTEQTIKSQEEKDNIAKQMGNPSFIPGLKVGSQTVAGFETGAWNNLLDLAGYPKTAPYGSKPSGASTQ